jgi:lysozyme
VIFIATYDGIDVSHYQGDINFSSVYSAGKKFVVVKCTEGSADGTAYFDPKFITNITNANTNKVYTHAYHYFLGISVSDSQNEADWFSENVIKADVKGYLFIDVEDSSLTTNKTDLTNYVNAFLDRLETNGFTKLGIYCSYSFMANKLIEANLKPEILKYIARYNTTLGRTADVWQYSSTGSVSGISGNVDLDVAYTDVMIKDANSTDTAPVAPDYHVTTAYNSLISGTVIATDAEGDILTYSKLSNPSYGTATVSSGGSWTYTPNDQFVGTDSFKVQVSDGTLTDTSTITISVSAPNITTPDASSISSLAFSQYLTTLDSTPIYSLANSSSTVVINIADKYSVVYYASNTVSNGYGYVKYIDENNVTYYGYIDLTKIDTAENIDNAINSQYNPEYYTVVSGDSINSIASSLSVTTGQLKLFNGWVNQKSVILTVGEQVRYK